MHGSTSYWIAHFYLSQNCGFHTWLSNTDLLKNNLKNPVSSKNTVRYCRCCWTEYMWTYSMFASIFVSRSGQVYKCFHFFLSTLRTSRSCWLKLWDSGSFLTLGTEFGKTRSTQQLFWSFGSIKLEKPCDVIVTEAKNELHSNLTFQPTMKRSP